MPSTTRQNSSPSSAIEPLSQQLNGRLSAVELLGGHIDVVYEDNEFFTGGGAEHAFSAFLAFTINQVLRWETGKRGRIAV